ncbi:HipA domain-containing protein [Ideonella sp. DXS29W]|uniref:HipA domain-containing protein n=1 Tax=Ideonella lacteola TaxID=2984193 RepID=A0ABU9BMK4_9BURK
MVEAGQKNRQDIRIIARITSKSNFFFRRVASAHKHAARRKNSQGNGDGHLKNFGVLYRSAGEAWLSPMFDVVTTSIYRYQRYGGGPELEDRTLALKLFAGRHGSKAYPTTEELVQFGRKICEVSAPQDVLQRIADAMGTVLKDTKGDSRIPSAQ